MVQMNYSTNGCAVTLPRERWYLLCAMASGLRATAVKPVRRVKAGARPVLALAIALGGTALCTTLQSCTASQRANTIALITPLTTSELWKSVHAGVVAATTQGHMNWYWNAPTHQDDAERQMDLVDRQVALGISGIVLVPAHGSALIPVVQQARRSDVPMVIADDALAIPLGSDIGMVTSDEPAAGRLAAALVRQLSHRGSSVAIVGVNPASTRVVQRIDAFETELHHAGTVKITLKLDDTVGPGGKSESDLLKALGREPTMQTIFTPSLSATRAVYATLQQQGLLRRIQVVGCDQDEDLYPPIRRGEIAGLVAQNAFQIGYQATEMLIRRRLHHSAMQHIVIAPLLLQKANLDEATTRQFLRPYSGFDR